jgi:SAM-dependent methyltransferase
LPFGSVFSLLGQITLTQYSLPRVQTQLSIFKNSWPTRVGLKIFGIPHIGLRLRANQIMKNIPYSSERMLDAGFGTGIYSFTLSRYIDRIVAVDNEELKVYHARAENPFKNIEFQKMSLTSLGFPNASFDLVVCSDVIEHISNDALAFAEIARVTKKNGIILFTVPYVSQKNKDSYRKFDHQRAGYSQEDIKKLCDANGLRITNVNTYSYNIAERASNFNYRIIKYKSLLLFLFYPLYTIARISDRILQIGEPNGIYFRIIKEI